ncbi:MAG TPA: Uma2 family endonuclease [Chloroflexota bacterium]|nr:Uma2 family endonuclease [Chloroflexota bacterium]
MSTAHALPPNPAPWAEVVPNAPRMTVADLAILPDDGWQYELVEGVLVRMPLSGGEASMIAYRLGARLGVYVEDHNLGAVTGADGGYDFSSLGQPDTELAPDAAFVRTENVPDPASPEYEKAWPVAPDLVIEVASPHQWRPQMEAKVARYLAAGVRLVWLIWPRWRQVDVWHSGDAEPSLTLLEGEILNGEDVVPGFTYPVDRLFA